MFLIYFNDDVDYIDVYTVGNVHMHNTCKPMSTRFISLL